MDILRDLTEESVSNKSLMAVWLDGCMAVWLYGCMAGWLYDCMAVWLDGCMTNGMKCSVIIQRSWV